MAEGEGKQAHLTWWEQQERERELLRPYQHPELERTQAGWSRQHPGTALNHV